MSVTATAIRIDQLPAVLFLGDDPESKRALDDLTILPFLALKTVQVRPGDPHYINGMPVLYAFSTRFEGTAGISVFLKNASLLGYPAHHSAA